MTARRSPALVKLWAGIKRLLPAGLSLALVVAVTTCVVNERNVRVASVQTYNLTRLSTFQESGRAMDEKIAALFDAAAAGESLDAPRREARSAIRTHATQGEALQGVFTTDELAQYNQRLVTMRLAVDATRDQTQSRVNVTTFGALIQKRRAIVSAAMERLD